METKTGKDWQLLDFGKNDPFQHDSQHGFCGIGVLFLPLVPNPHMLLLVVAALHSSTEADF